MFIDTQLDYNQQRIIRSAQGIKNLWNKEYKDLAKQYCTFNPYSNDKTLAILSNFKVEVQRVLDQLIGIDGQIGTLMYQNEMKNIIFNIK